MDVGQDTTRGDRDATEELVQLLIVLDGERDVAGDNTTLLVVTGGVAGELEDFGAEILEDGRKVDGRTGSHAGGVLNDLRQERVSGREKRLQRAEGHHGKVKRLVRENGKNRTLPCRK